MPRPRTRRPGYCHDRATGRAYVALAGRKIYLGPYGTPASRTEYERVVREWENLGRPRLDYMPSRAPAPLTVAELIAAFWTQHVQAYYRTVAGEPTSEQQNIRRALRPLLVLYKDTAAAEFGPLRLKDVRQHMIKLGWCRTNINKAIARIKLAVKWGVENELIPASTHHGLAAVPGLRAGRSDAREAEPVKPVPESTVDATLPHLPDTVADMVRLQLLTGMRPGEVCAMTSGDIDTTGRLWQYRPTRHKTQHHGHDRIVDLGPRARAIVEQYIKADLSAPLFSPAESESRRLARLHERRTTPLSCGNRPGKRRRELGDRFDVATYRRAIARACEAAFAMPAELRDPRPGTRAHRTDTAAAKDERRELRREWHDQHIWHPHQLRHTAATKLRKQYGLEAARIILGHKTLAMTELYAEQDRAEARRIMGEIG